MTVLRLRVRACLSFFSAVIGTLGCGYNYTAVSAGLIPGFLWPCHWLQHTHTHADHPQSISTYFSMSSHQQVNINTKCELWWVRKRDVRMDKEYRDFYKRYPENRKKRGLFENSTCALSRRIQCSAKTATKINTGRGAREPEDGGSDKERREMFEMRMPPTEGTSLLTDGGRDTPTSCGESISVCYSFISQMYY